MAGCQHEWVFLCVAMVIENGVARSVARYICLKCGARKEE